MNDSNLLSGMLVDEPLAEPASGIYFASADTPAYGWLEGLALRGFGTYEGTKYASGRKYIAVRLETDFLEQNVAGQIRVGPEYFTKALREYEDWRVKWWREAIQNGVDAGATRIDCAVHTSDDQVLVTCADNGSGMDEATLIDKFLVFGGTTKVGPGTRGGFGVAKELLVLPWLRWKIHTLDHVAEGQGIEYEVNPAPMRKGTELTVTMAPDQSTHGSAAIAFIEKCELPTVRFSVTTRDEEGDEQSYKPKASLKCVKPLRDFGGKAILCHNVKVPGYGELLVRTMGLYMFGMYVPSAVKGTLLVELKGSSVDLLTSNRDGFRDKQLKRDVEGYVNELAADVRSALKAKQGLIREKFRGAEGTYVAEREAKEREGTMLDSLEIVAPDARGAGKKLQLSEEQLRAVLDSLARGLSPPDRPVGITSSSFEATPELAAVMLDGTPMGGPTAVEAAVKQLSWRLDFLLVNEVEGFRVPSKFRPEKMTGNVRRLARTWGELCRFVLIQLGSSTTFGIGFVFDRDTGAQYEFDNGEHWLMLNPIKDPSRVESNAPIINPANADDLQWLYAAAVHECTHMADGITYHDESFAAAMTRNVARTSGKEKQIRAIKRLVSAQEKEQAAKRPSKPTSPGSRRLRELDKTRRVEAMHIGQHSIFLKADEHGNEVFDEMPFDSESHYTYDDAYERATTYADSSGKTFEIRDADREGRVVEIVMPAAGPVPPPEPPAIAPELEEARQRAAVAAAEKGYPYVAFVGGMATVFEHWSDEERAVQSAQREADASGEPVELRDGEHGGLVFRVLQPGHRPVARDLPPALEETRRREAVYMASKGLPFVAFEGDEAHPWDHHSDFDALLVRAQDEADLYNEVLEIRDGNEGGAVRRVVEKRT